MMRWVCKARVKKRAICELYQPFRLYSGVVDSVSPDAITTLTIEVLGLYDILVIDTNSGEALDRGVIHVPDTAYPWDSEDQKNVLLAGYRTGVSGTNGQLLFFDLDELSSGDSIFLTDRTGRSYLYSGQRPLHGLARRRLGGRHPGGSRHADAPDLHPSDLRGPPDRPGRPRLTYTPGQANGRVRGVRYRPREHSFLG